MTAARKLARKPADAGPLRALNKYRAKRDFTLTPEPAEGGAASPDALQYVIQKHWATRLHYDLRLELDGVMLSWAVPKGPSYDSRDKRMAVHVEDHPISYNSFEGQIPEKQYGAGKVVIWDKGSWLPLVDPHAGLRDGNLKFELFGHKLRGKWALVRIKSREGKQDTWLLLKERDAFVRPASEFSVVDEFPDSVAELPMPDGPVALALPVPASEGEGNAESGAAATVGRGRRRKLAMPAGAVKAKLPDKLAPVLATLVDAPPARPEDWLFEIKFDGYRMLARIDAAGGVRLITRNGHDWSARMPKLVQAIERMKLKPGWLDGEVVVLTEQGGTDFQALQNAFDSSSTGDIVYFVFDLPFYDGHDLRRVPLVERRELLLSLLAGAPAAVRASAVFDAAPQDIMASAVRIGLEGIIGKRKNSLYGSRRSADWIKLKTQRRQEFVIGGYTDPKGSRQGLGSLLLGVHDEQGALLYAGNVGSGFNEASLSDIAARLRAIACDERPFDASTGIDRRAHWVEPRLVAEVSFAEWTADGHLRHPVFHALREDKPARAIVRELPRHLEGAEPGRAAPDSALGSAPESVPVGAARTAAARTLPAGLKVSNPERVIDAESGVSKIELVRFYGLVAPLMMPHLKARPVSLVRAPNGIAGELFFQKHLDKGSMAGIRQLDPALSPGHEPLLEVAAPEGLLSAAQMNTIEFHTWNAIRTSIGKPDRMTFDLDPGEGVRWDTVRQGAELVRVFLEQLELPSFCKTSGGKGLHVVVPLRKQYGWETVKGFSGAIVAHLARTLPQIFVAKAGPRNRVGRIFIDYLRNGFGATTACAWSARARPGLGVSVPIAWAELAKLTGSAQWTVRNIHQRMDRGNEPWKDYEAEAQGLARPMKRLGFERID